MLSTDCNDGDIRLVGGVSRYEGTVEICFGNLWGLIAQTGWGDSDAQVACRQLEYNSEGIYQHYMRKSKMIHVMTRCCVVSKLSLWQAQQDHTV